MTFDTTSSSDSPLATLGVTVFERGWLSSNNMLVMGRDATALVDTGYTTHAPQTLALVTAALKGRPLDLIANTHLHSDHCGGNAALKTAFPDARRYIPPGEADAVGIWDPTRLTFEPTGQQCDPFGFDSLLVPGETIRLGDLAWEIHAARGHDPHSVVLFEPIHRVLMSADALWENGFGIVFPELDGEEGFDDVHATLAMIKSLDAAWVIPGHGRVFSDVASALGRAHSRLHQFSTQPDKHRRHALKVLIKFKLLEWQQATLQQLSTWFTASSYFTRIARQDATGDMAQVLQGLLTELESSGALRRDGDFIRNH